MGEYLYHFSEDPTVQVFAPRVAPTQQVEGAYVWADDAWHQPRYWFPRDCPRGTWWPKGDTDWSHHVHAIQWEWWDAFVNCELYAYTLDAAPFRENPGGGGWITEETVTPLDVQPVGPLLDRHRAARIELRIVDDLWALWLEVIERPGIGFSGIRLKNLPQHPEARAV
jgi:hypothetical protein